MLTEDKVQTKRVQVNLSGALLEALEKLGNAQGKDAATVIRDALGLYEWAYDNIKSGKKLALVETDASGKNVQEVVLPNIR